MIMVNYFQKAIFSPLHFVLPSLVRWKWLMNEWLLLTHQGQLNNQNIEQPRSYYCNKECVFQGQYNCSWHTGPTPFLPWLDVIPQRGILFVFPLPFCHCAFMPRSSTVLWNALYVQPTCFSVEKMSCCLLVVTFLWKECYSVPWCILCGPCSVFRNRIKMQGNFRKYDTYPSTLNLRLLRFQI